MLSIWHFLHGSHDVSSRSVVAPSWKGRKTFISSIGRVTHRPVRTVCHACHRSKVTRASGVTQWPFLAIFVQKLQNWSWVEQPQATILFLFCISWEKHKFIQYAVGCSHPQMINIIWSEMMVFWEWITYINTAIPLTFIFQNTAKRKTNWSLISLWSKMRTF